MNNMKHFNPTDHTPKGARIVSTWILAQRILLLLLSFAIHSSIMAEVSVADLFKDHMVLQQKQDIPLWGWGLPGEDVKIKFMDEETSTKVDEYGCWKTKLSPRAANKNPQQLSINHMTLKNILIGEVWLASGAEMGLATRMCIESRELLERAANPMIRLCSVDSSYTPLPEDRAGISWQECNKDSATKFSGTAMVFAQELSRSLDVPIGIISSCFPSTPMTNWIPAQGFRDIPELHYGIKSIYPSHPSTKEGQKRWEDYLNQLQIWLPKAKITVSKGGIPTDRPELPTDLWVSHVVPTKTFNAMIHPLIPFSIKGVIWDHSDFPENKAKETEVQQKAIINTWRDLWGQGDFPFYIVQSIARNKRNDLPQGDVGIPMMRELQQKSAELAHSGMVVTYDLGPVMKRFENNRQDIGKRLAKWALAKDYGKDEVYSGPLYQKMEIESDRLIIHFEYVNKGLMVGEKKGIDDVTPSKKELKGFAIAGQDKVWHWAQAIIDPDRHTVTLTSGQVKKPVAARYAYRSNPSQANLYNDAGLPAAPFRTDNWSNKKK